ncbi:DUF3047 domain-containing protein [Hydrogenophaga sp. MI9]|uniref:DUF3047 domain-containing protein n=1 Tax=Hydrogenophaga sp. MI9 TaxID=3453719 RepID=UPI003EE8B612
MSPPDPSLWSELSDAVFSHKVVVFKILVAGAVCVAMVGCAGLTGNEELSSAREPRAEVADMQGAAWNAAVTDLLHTPSGGEPWMPFRLPGKRFAGFEIDRKKDRAALSVQSDKSVSILRRQFAHGGPQVGQIDFSWMVEALPEGANLHEAENEDAPVRILLAFDGDRSKLSARTHRLSEMSRLLTGEELPYATLMYVWSNHDAPDTVVINPRTDRIRKVVVESGDAQVGKWRDYRRDVRSDFIRAFGEEPGPLRAVALMTDTDNTRSRLRAWYGPMTLGSR